MKVFFSIISMTLLILVHAIGCGDVSASPLNNVQFISVDESSGIVVSMTFDRSTLEITDRLTVSYRVQYPEHISIQLDTPDFAAHDWTVIDQVTSPQKRISTQMPTDPTLNTNEQLLYEQELVFFIEPFLDGEYIIPVPVITYSPLENHDPIELAVQFEDQHPTITVKPALEVSDSLIVSDLPHPVDSASIAQDESPVHYAVFVAIILVCSCIMGFVFIRPINKHQVARSTAIESLNQIAIAIDKVDSANENYYQELYAVLISLEPQIKGTTEIGDLISQCEQYQYAKTPSSSILPPHAIASHILEILGTDKGVN